MERIRSHKDLLVYQKAHDTAMRLFFASNSFPKEETYSLTDQVRRSSRSVATNLAEAWRKRRYAAAFISKLSDSETEAAETQAWIEFAVKCGYLDRSVAAELYRTYDQIMRNVVGMVDHADRWLIHERNSSKSTKPTGRRAPIQS